jgi:hypothetical protein
MMGSMTRSARGIVANVYLDIILWGGVLILILIVGYLGLAWLRRWLYARKAASVATPWTLEGIRQMRDMGMIDEAEYARMREALLASIRGRPEPAEGDAESGEADADIVAAPAGEGAESPDEDPDDQARPSDDDTDDDAGPSEEPPDRPTTN